MSGEETPQDPEKQLDETDKELLAEQMLDERRQQGIKLLPNTITTAAMFFGFFAIMQAIDGHLSNAAWAIFAAGICDGLDGRVARLTKSTSAFGMEYDSLSDLISFGFAPAMLAFFWAFQDPIPHKFGWAVAFIYTACAAIRLAKFNTLTGEEESRKFFRGIPSPMAAGLVISPVMMQNRGGALEVQGLHSPFLQWFFLVWVVCIGLLMVSNIRFRTFKDVNFRKFGPMLPMVGAAAFIAILMARPHETIFVGAHVFLIVGLIEGGIILRRREGELREAIKAAKRRRRLERKLQKRRAKQEKKEAREKDGGFRIMK